MNESPQSEQKSGIASLVLVLTALGPMALAQVNPDMIAINVEVGVPTLLSPTVYQNTSSLAVSRTGVVAVFYGYEDGAPRFYRTSNDAGATWGPERPAPPQLRGGGATVALREGGVLQYLGKLAPVPDEPDWFEGQFARYSDDMQSHTVETVRVHMPGAITERIPGPYVRWWPIFDKGKIIQLADGALLAPMYGLFAGDPGSRVVLSRSTDQGRTWRYFSTIAQGADDPHPELPGVWAGYTESSITVLPNGNMLAAIRTQGSHLGPEFRPIYTATSADLGLTWTPPRPTQPYLFNIWPQLQTLDNGIVGCSYGRPGVHISFSSDNGATWPVTVTFSQLYETTSPKITGEIDLIKLGPDRLLAVAGVEGGTKVWPLRVSARRQ